MGMPASSKAGGQCVANAPDVCKTPAAPSPIPTPYPNMAQVSSAQSTVDKVQIQKKDTVVESSKISSSSGDEAGTLGGMVSNLNRGEVDFKSASSKVYAKGKKVVLVGAMTAHNGSNANVPVGAQVAPSQTKVLVAS